MRSALRFLLLTLLLTAALPPASYGAHLTGRVVEVHSGDVIEIIADDTAMRIHLYGIHCPETGQAYGTEAVKFTTLLAYGKIVTVQIVNRDRRGGMIGKVMLPGERNLNCELLKAGLAWWNRQGAPDDRILKILERSAMENRTGLWSDPDPVPPWEFRETDAAFQTGSENSLTPSRPYSENTTVYVTSTGEKYHRNSCRYLMKSMIPMRLGDARTSGLVSCPACDPPK